MKVEDLFELTSEELVKKLVDNNTVDENLKIDTWRGEYDGSGHAILDTAIRPDKIVGTESTKKQVKVARNVVTFQKKIVRMAVAFLLGNPPTLTLESDQDETGEAFTTLKNAWKKAKLKYFNKRLMRDVCVETHAAELWFTKPNPRKAIDPREPERTVGVILLSKRTGNQIYPLFDEFGDMIAFTREYENKITGEDGQEKDVRNVHVYTDTKTIKLTKRSGEEWEREEEQNLFGKIPVIYYKQDSPEWKDAQELIDQLEKNLSDHSDTNAYFSSPAIKSKGKIANPPEKNEIGKFFELLPEKGIDGNPTYGDIDYLTWSQSPESLKLEYDHLKELIYSMTSTPDISFNNVKGIGNVSGVALKLMFLDALLKADEKTEVYGECFERRNNLLISMLSMVNITLKSEFSKLDVSVEFHDPLPDDISSLIDTLTTAVGGEAIMSQESAVAKNPLVNDVTEEMEKIKSESESVPPMTGESYGIREDE